MYIHTYIHTYIYIYALYICTPVPVRLLYQYNSYIDPTEGPITIAHAALD